MPENEITGFEVDPSDTQLATEYLGEDFDPSVDSHATFSPPNDGVHLVKLSRAMGRDGKARPWIGRFYGDDVELVKRANKQEMTVEEAQVAGLRLHYSTGIMAASLEPGNDFRLFDYTVSTRPGRNGGSSASDIIRAATGTPAVARDSAKLMKECESLLSSEAQVAVETKWEASCLSCKEKTTRGAERNHTIFQGQKRFPVLKRGENGKGNVYNHEIECPKCGSPAMVSARIVRYLPSRAYKAVGELQTTNTGAKAAAAAPEENPFL